MIPNQATIIVTEVWKFSFTHLNNTAGMEWKPIAFRWNPETLLVLFND